MARIETSTMMKQNLIVGATILLLACWVQGAVGRPSELNSEDLFPPAAAAGGAALTLNDDSASASAETGTTTKARNEQGVNVRERRSPDFQPRQPQPQQQPRQPSQQQESGSRGDVTVGVHRERGVGTVVSAQGSGNVWRSRDGTASVDANGHYERVVRGPMRSRPSYGGGVTFTKRF